MSELPSPGNETSWDKLRRRKVVQWGLAYAAVAWSLLQVLEFAVGTFQWPPVLTRIGAVVAAFGVPVTVTLAWYHGDRGEQRFGRAELAVIASLVMAGLLVVVQVARVPPGSATRTSAGPARAPATLDRRRLAVLPFANFGNDPANAAFVSGVHDTLITQIAKVPGLSVISRSSVMQFEGRNPQVRAVAAALGVGTVLEGSVERDGQRLRVQAQLIDATSDRHLWAETYDRTADDLFAVQMEIAQAVAQQLRIRLTNDDSRRLAEGLTANSAAYEHYVLGRSHAARRDWQPAIAELTQAVTIDPGFAAAYAQLSMAHTWLAFEDSSKRTDLIPLARQESDEALKLDPTLPEAHLARAVYFYRGEPDVERATSEFERAIAGLPNDAQAHLGFGYLRRWQGRWDEAAALMKRAASLDPGGIATTSAANALAGLGRRAEANEVIAAGRAAKPDDAGLAVLPAVIAGDMDCDLATAESTLANARRQFPDSWELLRESWFFAWQTGDTKAALAAAERYAVVAGPDDDSSRWRLGIAKLAVGQVAESRAVLRDSLLKSQKSSAVLPSGEQLSNGLSWIALHYSVLGEHERAVATARRALEQLPRQGAMMQRTETLYLSAAVFARAGDLRAAEPLLRETLSLPATRRASGAWCDPLFAPLRKDPRFRSLIAELGGDVTVDPARRETWPRVPASN